MGKGSIANPEALDKVTLDNSSGLGENSCLTRKNIMEGLGVLGVVIDEE